jgi:sRNA-binding regulator protein Hfq
VLLAAPSATRVAKNATTETEKEKDNYVIINKQKKQLFCFKTAISSFFPWVYICCLLQF